ncbi:antifreeze protein Maxi-like [Hibiscus syriacus]|uniref:antifreeze protein Maxi-like n=1 Tax=Hibiscus syriacus TaxID=106335 RepID=UPI001923A776|nr:antifreeze protein Maxi-like [Hibiscus syriacus]
MDGSAGIVTLAPAWLRAKGAEALLVAGATGLGHRAKGAAALLVEDAAAAAATGLGHRAKGAAALLVEDAAAAAATGLGHRAKGAAALLVEDAVGAATGLGHPAKGAAACRVVGAVGVAVDTDTTIAGVVVKGAAAVLAADATVAIYRHRVSGAVTFGAAELVVDHVAVEGVASVSRERQVVQSCDVETSIIYSTVCLPACLPWPVKSVIPYFKFGFLQC